MILGLDYYGTISKHPQSYRELAEAVIQFDEVYIISAVKTGNRQRAEREIKKSGVQCTAIKVIEYDKLSQVKQLKLEACLELGVRVMIDDRQETVEYLSSKGIVGLLSY